MQDEGHALALYRGLAAGHPDFRVLLRPLVGVQREHVSALATALDTTFPSPGHVAVPGRPAQAVVAEAERLAARRVADCQEVESGGLASLLASMAAAHHVVAFEWASP
jgi:hypothetical protein